MNQIKIKKFIAQCRKNKNLTQMQLAEKLNISDRAISKWESGKGMPDSSIMLLLCNTLGITVNELLNGEYIKIENYNKKAEENLLEMAKKEEIQNRNMMMYEWIIGSLSSITFLILLFTLSYCKNYIVYISFFNINSWNFLCFKN